VAGSGKPFLPSLTLPVNRDFFCPFIFLKTFLTAENAKRAENAVKALDQVMGKDPVEFFYSL
jgi:hypothetical protein